VTGTLSVAATPIGNPHDAGVRLTRALQRTPIIAAEDTRRIRRLAADLEVSIAGRVVSFFEGNESARTERLLQELHSGNDVLLVTDAGMPGVSDPGHRLIRACAAEGIRVTVLPGPSAVLAALVASGLPTDRFCFEGFLPRKSGERGARLRELAGERRTMVFFESPRRLAAVLDDMAAAFGADRPASVCRELTKTHEEVQRGTLSQLVQWAAREVLGEITVVVAGAQLRPTGDPESWRRAVADLVAGGMSRRDAIDQVAASGGAPRREVYRAVHA
jgi:16S rRNA (cytidine1402-2'-O)-methyltransferase